MGVVSLFDYMYVIVGVVSLFGYLFVVVGAVSLSLRFLLFHFLLLLLLLLLIITRFVSIPAPPCIFCMTIFTLPS